MKTVNDLLSLQKTCEYYCFFHRSVQTYFTTISPVEYLLIMRPSVLYKSLHIKGFSLFLSLSLTHSLLFLEAFQGFSSLQKCFKWKVYRRFLAQRKFENGLQFIEDRFMISRFLVEKPNILNDFFTFFLLVNNLTYKLIWNKIPNLNSCPQKKWSEKKFRLPNKFLGAQRQVLSNNINQRSLLGCSRP